jgi:hypothetical protein
VNTYTAAQKTKANEVLGGYVSQGAEFSNELYQRNHKDWLFTAKVEGMTTAVVIGPRGAVKDHWVS